MNNLRPYQLEAVQSVFRELHYRQSTLVVHPTGSGKTHEMAATARVWLKREGKRILSLAPREELLEQAAEKYRQWMPWLRPNLDLGFEQGGRKVGPDCKVVLASLQSLHDGRLRRAFDPDHFGLIIADEAHLYIDALTRIFGHFAAAKRVGFSATPDRADERRLLPYLFESVAHHLELGDLIEQRHLCPLEFRRVEIDSIVLDDVDDNEQGDFAEGSLAAVMMQPEVVDATAVVALEQSEGRPTLAFAVNLEHARRLAAALNKYLPGSARTIDGTQSPAERRAILSGFRTGAYPVLVSVLLCTYGLDVPEIACIVHARPTKSRALRSQMDGRGTRLLGASYEASVAAGKASCRIVDLVGNTSRLRLVTPEESLLPSGELPFVASPAPALEVEPPQPEEIAVDLEDSPPAPSALSANWHVTVGYRVVEVDNQLAVLGIDAGTRRQDSRPATEAQAQILRDLGIEDGQKLSQKQAEGVIEQLTERRRQGWCTLKQARYLQRRGLHPNVRFAIASEAIDKIEANRGRVPREMLLDPRVVHAGAETLVLKGDAQ